MTGNLKREEVKAAKDISRINPEQIAYTCSPRHIQSVIEDLIEEIRRLQIVEEASRWRPIETAPKDGTHILLYYPERDCCIGGSYVEITDGDWETGYKRWMEWQVDDELYVGDEGYSPTHWMPLPTPPQGE